MSLNASHPASLHSNRRGALVVLAAVLMVVMLGFVALGVDVGYINLARTQLQAAADAGALAGASALQAPLAGGLETEIVTVSGWNANAARLAAQEYANYHQCAGRMLDLDLNYTNDPGGDIVIGRYDQPGDLNEPLNLLSDRPNTVQVTLRLASGSTNGALQLFFARVFGINSSEVSATASAMAQQVYLLPFGIWEPTWDSLADGGAGDNFVYDPSLGGFGVDTGSDGIAEVKVFPDPDFLESTSVPGNFGLVQIGPDSSAEIVSNQIDGGPTFAQWAYHGGSLSSGVSLYGVTGMKVSIKHALLGGNGYAGMLGQVRYAPVFDSASGNGSNAQFHITKFVAIRVMAVDLDGAPHHTYASGPDAKAITGIWVQPVQDPGPAMKIHLVR